MAGVLGRSRGDRQAHGARAASRRLAGLAARYRMLASTGGCEEPKPAPLAGAEESSSCQPATRAVRGTHAVSGQALRFWTISRAELCGHVGALRPRATQRFSCGVASHRGSSKRLLWDVSTALDERAKESGADSARCTLHALRTLVTLATTGYSAQGSARGCHLRRAPEQDGSPHLQQQPRLRIIAAAQLFGAALRFPARRNPSRDDDC